MASSTTSVPPISVIDSRLNVRTVGDVLLMSNNKGTEPFSFGGKSYSKTKFPPKVFLTRLYLQQKKQIKITSTGNSL